MKAAINRQATDHIELLKSHTLQWQEGIKYYIISQKRKALKLFYSILDNGSGRTVTEVARAVSQF